MYKKRKKDNTALIQHFQEKQVGRLVFSRKAGKRPLPLKLKTISTRQETNLGFKRCLFRVYDTIHEMLPHLSERDSLLFAARATPTNPSLERNTSNVEKTHINQI